MLSPKQERNAKRTGTPSKEVIRSCWKRAIKEIEYLTDKLHIINIENIQDDSDDKRFCWCCGKEGYQESAHIIPSSLGGESSDPFNFFLLCSGCHLQAPDTINPEYFFEWLNEASPILSELNSQRTDKLLSFIHDLIKNHPPKNNAMIASIPVITEAAVDFASSRSSLHGADFSQSTANAIFDMVMKSFKSIWVKYNETGELSLEVANYD